MPLRAVVFDFDAADLCQQTRQPLIDDRIGFIFHAGALCNDQGTASVNVALQILGNGRSDQMQGGSNHELIGR